MKSLSFTIPDSVTPPEAASKETSRYAINGVLVKPSKSKPNQVALAATDGRALSVTFADFSGDADAIPASGVIVDVDVFPKKSDNTPASRSVTLNGSASLTNKKGYKIDKPYAEGTFPPIAAVVPKLSESKSVTLNIGLLSRLAASMGAQSVTLILEASDKPVGVIGSDGHGHQTGAGVIMPIRIPSGTQQPDEYVREAWQAFHERVNADLA